MSENMSSKRGLRGKNYYSYMKKHKDDLSAVSNCILNHGKSTWPIDMILEERANVKAKLATKNRRLCE
jgi:hypothetical protein